MKTHSSIAAVAVVFLASATAMAQGQPWLGDRSYGEGIGIRTGDLELHPGVAGEVGYDSNYFQRSGDTGNEYYWDRAGVASAMRFRLTPSLTLSTLSPQRKLGDAAGTTMPPKLNFSAGVFASYNELVGLSGPTEQMSKQRHVDAGASFRFDILPQRPIGVDLFGNFMRMVSPSNDAAIANSWNRDSLRGGLGVTWRPGGGLFDWRLGYEGQYNYFEADTYRNHSNFRNTLNTRGRWKFYPRTAFIYDAQTWWLNYTSSTPPRNGGQIIQARLGLNGLVTNQFALLAMAGWASTWFDGKRLPVPQNLNTVVGQAELRWYILPQPKLQPGDATIGLSSAAVGYVRDFNQSYMADYYRRDRAYGNVSYFVGGRYLIDLQAGYSRISHPEHFRVGMAAGEPVAAMGENRVDAQLFAEYRTSDSFGINATLRYDASLSRNNVSVIDGRDGTVYVDNLQFSRFTAWLGVRWFM